MFGRESIARVHRRRGSLHLSIGLACSRAIYFSCRSAGAFRREAQLHRTGHRAGLDETAQAAGWRVDGALAVGLEVLLPGEQLLQFGGQRGEGYELRQIFFDQLADFALVIRQWSWVCDFCPSIENYRCSTCNEKAVALRIFVRPSLPIPSKPDRLSPVTA